MGGFSLLRNGGKRIFEMMCQDGGGGGLACRASFFDHFLAVPAFAATSPNNLEYLLAMSKNLAHPLHPVYDDGKGGGWKWWE